MSAYSPPLLLLLFLFSSLPFFFIITCTSSPLYPAHVEDPEAVAEGVIRSIENSTTEAQKRRLGGRSCLSGNPIDDCWRCDPNWEKNRKRLADCALGFGRNAVGGRHGEIYVVNTSRDDDDYRNPTPGTLRYGVMQKKPLWIIFERDMSFNLKRHIIVESDKTIDGRGATVRISSGPCLVIRFARNIIIHGLHIYNCKQRLVDGDGLQIFRGSHVWVDHNYFSNCEDGLIDAVFGSTAITISNNYFTHHDHTILLGHSDTFSMDKKMQVTVAFNHFGKGLVQRMPRCRFGYFHVVNNDYTRWEMYAIGGSAGATINSQGNKFVAPNHRFHKQVTMRPNTPKSEWENWNWRSSGDEFHNGAFFVSSGSNSSSSYAKAWSLKPKLASLVGRMTADAGVLKCNKGTPCWVN